MNYTIEKLSVDNAHEYAYVNSRAWLESYKGIIEDGEQGDKAAHDSIDSIIVHPEYFQDHPRCIECDQEDDYHPDIQE